jgi:hypothetical protein
MRRKLLSQNERRALALVLKGTPRRMLSEPFAHPGRACRPQAGLARIRMQS